MEEMIKVTPYRMPNPLLRAAFLPFALFALALSMGSVARADYFAKRSFKTYQINGPYPFWSQAWLPLDPRVRTDAHGIPFVNYEDGSHYNPVTVAIFALLAHDRFGQSARDSDRIDFLFLAQWLVDHQDVNSGSWYYDFDFEYRSLGETIRKPWVSGMAQGLGISVMTRAYRLTHEPFYLRTAERALLPFRKDVKVGGVTRHFTLASASVPSEGSGNLLFFEEYPTQPAPSFTLNGFMFTLIGLCDLAQTGNSEAAGLFREGIRALEVALPLFDLGSGSAYDLGHLTRPPRDVHRDTGYHLVHIALLNALGTATENAKLVWYRDHWNSYGSAWETEGVLLWRMAYFVKGRYPVAAALTALLFLYLGVLALRKLGRVASLLHRPSMAAAPSIR